MLNPGQSKSGPICLAYPLKIYNKAKEPCPKVVFKFFKVGCICKRTAKMSRMNLRSSRSRSRTPFTTEETFGKDEIIAGNNVGKTVIRTTRRTTHFIQ